MAVKYACSSCKEERERDDLIVKRVQYKEMGVSGRLLITRTVAWLCLIKGADGRSCLERDEHYHREKYADAPGTIAKKFPDD